MSFELLAKCGNLWVRVSRQDFSNLENAKRRAQKLANERQTSIRVESQDVEVFRAEPNACMVRIE